MKPELTPQELRITRLVVFGYLAKEIPSKLPSKENGELISTKTVQNTIYNIYQKLGISNSIELAVYYYAKEKGLDISEAPSRLKRLLATLLLVILIPSIYSTITVRITRSNRTNNSARARTRTRQDYNFLTLEYYG